MAGGENGPLRPMALTAPSCGSPGKCLRSAPSQAQKGSESQWRSDNPTRLSVPSHCGKDGRTPLKTHVAFATHSEQSFREWIATAGKSFLPPCARGNKRKTCSV